MAEFNFSPILTPYVPAPTQEIGQAASYLQNVYDRALAEQNQRTNLLTSFDVAQPDVGLRDQYAENLENDLRALADKYQGDYTSRQFATDREAVYRKYIRDPRLQAMKSTKEANDFATKARMEAELQGRDLLFDDGRELGTAFDPETGQYTAGRFGGQMRTDWEGKARQLYGQVIPKAGSSFMGQIKKLADSPIGGYAFIKGEWSRWLDEDNLGRAKEIADAFISTDEGKQYLRYLETELGQDLSSQEAKRGAAIKFIADINADKVFDHTKYSSQFIAEPEKKDGDNDDSLFGNIEDFNIIENISNELNPSNFEYKDRIVNADFDKNSKEDKLKALDALDTRGAINRSKTTTRKGFNFSNDLERKTANSLARMWYGEDLDDLTDRQKEEFGAKSSEYLKQLPDHIQQTYFAISPDDYTDADKSINRNIDGRKVFSLKDKKYYDSGKVFTKEKGFDEETPIEVIGRFRQTNPFSRMTGDDDFVNAIHARIGGPGGEDVILTEPRGVQRATGEKARVGSAIHSTVLTGLPVNLKGTTDGTGKATITKDIYVLVTGDGIKIDDGKKQYIARSYDEAFDIIHELK